MSVPVGSVQRLRFCFTRRPLSREEREAFDEGLRLPAGVGLPAASVTAEVHPPEGLPHATLPATADGEGEYHVQLAVTEDGTWRWRGVGVDGEGKPVAATAWQVFTAG